MSAAGTTAPQTENDDSPVFFINLARSRERRTRMEQRLTSFPVVRRVDAVDGRSLSYWERFWLYQAPLSAKLRHGRVLRAGEIGTCLSHQTVYRKMIEENVSRAIILEDDVILDRTALRRLLSLLNIVSIPWDVLLLHNHSGLDPHKICFRQVSALNEGISIMGLVDEPCSSGAYIITNIGAAKMLRMRRFDSPSDYWCRFAMRTGIRVFAVSPMIASVDSSFSSDVDSIAQRKQSGRKSVSWFFRKTRKRLRNQVRAFAQKYLDELTDAISIRSE